MEVQDQCLKIMGAHLGFVANVDSDDNSFTKFTKCSGTNEREVVGPKVG